MENRIEGCVGGILSLVHVFGFGLLDPLDPYRWIQYVRRTFRKYDPCWITVGMVGVGDLFLVLDSLYFIKIYPEE